MRKLTLWVAFAAITMTSCSKTESFNETTKKQIAFDASVGKRSKAGSINGTAFPYDDANYYFSVLAYYKPDGGSYNYSSRYINDVPVFYTAGAWKNQTPYYWPETGTLKFVAYAPYLEVAAPEYNETDGIILPDFDATPNIDLMYTDAISDLSSGPVDMVFKHALTQVYFTMATTQPGVEFQIEKFTIQPCVSKGSFKSLPTPAWTRSTHQDDISTRYEIYRNMSGASDDVKIKSSDSAPIEFSTRLLLIPQPVTTIDLTIEYHQTTSGVLHPTLKTKTFTLNGDAWEPNQRVKYAITITDTGITEITYNPTVETWAVETAGTTAP